MSTLSFPVARRLNPAPVGNSGKDGRQGQYCRIVLRCPGGLEKIDPAGAPPAALSHGGVPHIQKKFKIYDSWKE